MKTVLICGGAGFIGHHIARKLKSEGHYVVVADIKTRNEYCKGNDYCHQYLQLDLTKDDSWNAIHDQFKGFDEVYQLAADMGGAGYIFTGDNDANVMTNSSLVNLHCVQFATKWKAKVFYSSSACMYPSHNQEDPDNPNCKEDSAYPANPDSEYGWEKLFSERLYLAAARNYGLDVRVARFHNIFGPEGTYEGGKEKAPAALCRKVIQALSNSQGGMSGTMMDEARIPRRNPEIEVWGPGTQTRSFLYIDECIEAVQRLMKSDFKEPVNIGSDEMISINNLAKMVIEISGKECIINNIEGPLGVMGRNSDNKLIKEKLGWSPSLPLRSGIKKTYEWIKNEL
jgi:GDP-D-mannose 3', 5'-epimerase